jgi:hypothetical protein
MPTANDIETLRQSHSPQPLQGRVADGLHIGIENGTFYIYDDRQTAGYLCATASTRVLQELLEMEEAHKGSVRTLITDEPSPYDILLHYPTPAFEPSSYAGPVTFNIQDIIK